MSTKRQHYVPKIYLKSWETIVSSKKQPKNIFKGINYFERNDLYIGDGRNKDSVLWHPHTYTVDYEHSFMLHLLPEIEKDYIVQVINKLKERKVAAFLNEQHLKSKKKITENFIYLDDWEFKHNFYPFNIAKKSAIISDIKSIHSYVIEDALDNVVEKKWQSSLNEFIYQMENTIPINGIDEIRQIEEKVVIEIVRMILFLMCRNPDFDCLGIFPAIKHVLFDNLFDTINNDEQKSLERITLQQMKAIWIGEIYKGLFNINNGFFYALKQHMDNSCQIMLYKCKENQGSFITSDNPAFTHISFATANNLNSIICPLTPKYLVMILKGENKCINNVNFRLASNALIKKLNMIILNYSQNAIISDCKYLGYIL